MSALARDRDTPHKYKERKQVLEVAETTKIYAGAIVAVNAGGYAVPAADIAGLIVQGRAEEQVDNLTGANGAKKIAVSRGVFRYDVASITIANIGDTATVVDDQTVGLAAGTTNDIAVGVIEEVDTVGAWVRIGIG